MSAYLDQILGIYAPDVPGVREALTAIVEAEVERAVQDEYGLLFTTAQADVYLAARRDGASITEATASAFATPESVLLLARAERAEADAATLREKLSVAVAYFSEIAAADQMNFPDRSEFGRFWSAWLQHAHAALTSGGQA